MRDYGELKWYSKERKEYYANVNNSREKMIGDEGEKLIWEFFERKGLEVIYSLPNEDANNHVDFWVKVGDEWLSVDVKHQANMTLEIKNNWGNTGSTMLPDEKGADVVVHLLRGTGVAYVYQRSLMRDWWEKHKGLHQFTTNYQGATLFRVYPDTLREMSFVHKLTL